MPASTTHGLPYPVAGDAPAGHTQMQSLAEAVDAKVLVTAKSLIATEESRSNASYGTLTTPDTVSLTVPSTDCLILVSYVCDIKESTQNTARITYVVGNAGNFARLPANPGTTLTANTYGGFFTGIIGGSATAGDPPGVWTTTVPSADPSIPITQIVYSPIATGTWTFDVRFATTSGATVTVKNRKLRARLVNL
jgi:hypothetical protein